MTTSHEAVREREALKYDGDYVSRSIINVRHARHTNPEIEARLRGSSPLPSVLSTATDGTLTSLAQLAAFRLNCKRALISLYDRNFQYIIAEATQALPLQPGIPRPDLWLCGTGIPRTHGICEHVLVAPLGETLPVSVVPDLAEDGRFCDRHYIHNAPFNRFYAGVPIRTHKGINIGVLCVFDEKTRSGLDDESIDFLRDLSRNIMSYLEARRVRDAASRHEKMVRGLGSFVEGDSQISGLDRKLNGKANFETVGSDLVDPEECGALYTRKEEIRLQLKEHEADQLGRPLHQEDARATTESLVEVAEQPIRPIDPASVRSTSDSPLRQNPATLTPALNMTDAHGSSHFSEVKLVFAKAANIIRQSIDVDGVVFLDASISSFGGLVDMDRVTAEASLESLSSLSSGDESMANASLRSERLYGSSFCSVLGFSTTEQSSLNHEPPDPGYSLVKEKFLRALLRRFPKGQIMNFDSEGLILPSDNSSSEDDNTAGSKSLERDSSESSASHHSRSRPRQTWVTQAGLLLKIFPGIRSLAILPVWDASRERWFAGGFIFTRSSSRIFTSEVELGFLRTFGKAIQTELIQIETTFSEKIKSDALGSLSHELRSPLHGLLGACELLHDTRMSAFQRDMVRMAETSGRTLLDVIDHLLDYSKISSIRGNQDQSPSPLSRKPGQNLGAFDSKNQHLTAVDVGLIVEEVIESVSTGHNFEKIAAADIPKRQSNESLRATTSSPVPADSLSRHPTKWFASDANQVSVYLDIDHGPSWHMMAYPGAIRRIVMNILGNSLKFTSDGFIFVSLKQESSPRFKQGNEVVLTVIDSGRGITEDFLQHQLFKPFSQEDKLSPGTGLGLNVVKQIVNMLQGNITVLSQPGLGTKTVVSIPLAHAPEPDLTTESFLSDMAVLKGQRVQLTGFDNALHTHFLASRRMEEKTILSRLCQDWFGMTVIKDLDWQSGEIPDIIIVNETSLEQVELHLSGKLKCPVLIVCHNSIAAHEISSRTEKFGHGTRCHHITQPIGPRKLAQALISSIEQQQQRFAQAMNVTTEQDLLTPNALLETSVTGILEMVDKPEPDLSSECGTFATASSQDEHSTSPESTYSDDDVPTEVKALPSPSLADPASTTEAENRTAELAARLKDTDLRQPELRARVVMPNPEEFNFLVVDDNKINVQILSSFLKKLKKPHSTAMDGLEALEAYTSSSVNFDYVFMDISMPRMDGLEATRRIRMFEREHPGRKPAKIVALTGLVSEEIQKEAFASGIDLFLTKPVKLQQLKDLIGQHNTVPRK